jgi:hypothetical protein
VTSILVGIGFICAGLALWSLHREVGDLRMRLRKMEADAADEQWLSNFERLMSERKESAD